MSLRIPSFLVRSASTTAARLSSVATLVVVMAIGARRFTPDQFGVWTILYALMNFALAVDFGFRFALGNRLAAVVASNDHDEAQRAFLCVFMLEAAIGIAGFTLCILCLRHFDWAAIFHVKDEVLATELRWLFPLVCGLFLLNQPFTLAATTFFAHQQIVVASMYSIAQSVLLIIVFVVGARFASFEVAVLMFFVSYVIAGALFTLYLLWEKGWKWQLASWHQFTALIRSVHTPALEFFALSLCAMTATTISPLLVGSAAGAEQAGDFSLVQRLFNLLLALHLAALTPLAPAFTAQAHIGNWSYVEDKLRFCVRILWPLLFVAGGAGLVLIHPIVLRIWSGKWITDYLLAVLLALAAILGGWANTYSILLNSLGAVRLQAIVAWIIIGPAILLPALLARWFGVHGVAAAALVTTIPSAAFTWWYARQIRRRRLVRV